MEKNEKKPMTEDEKLDEALKATFPASDPLAMTDPYKHLGRGKKPSPKNKGAKSH